MINFNYKIYKGLLISIEYKNSKDYILKAYLGFELIEKQRYINSLPSDSIKDFQNYLDTNFFQFNTIL